MTTAHVATTESLADLRRTRRPRRVALLTTVLALVATLLVASPIPAAAQGDWSVEVGTYTIPDSDGAIETTLMVSPAASDLAGVMLQIDYDESLVNVLNCDVETDLGSCNATTPGRIVVNAVTGDAGGWDGDFVLAGIGFEGQGVEATSAIEVTVMEAYNAALTEVSSAGNPVDGAITVSSRAPAATVELACAGNDGVVQAALDNPMDDPVTFNIAVEGLDTQSFTLAPGTSSDETVGGIADSRSVGVTVTADGWPTLYDSSLEVRCDAEVVVTQTCGANGATIDVNVVNYTGGFATYRAEVANMAQQRSISDSLTASMTYGPFVDGNIDVNVLRNGTSIYNTTEVVDCGVGEPTPVPPTPTPVPPTPVPEPPSGAEEVQVVSTCLLGNGRVDHNIVNTSGADATYRVEFGQLSARQFIVKAGDWRRQPITGRPEGMHNVVVKRDGQVIVDEMVEVKCDEGVAEVDEPPLQVVNACRNGLGFVLLQAANSTAEPAPYVFEFEGVRNRSQTAPAFGAAVKAVTGRPPGTYDVRLRLTDGTELATATITIDCSWQQ